MPLLGSLRYSHYYTGEETEAQKDKVTCQRHTVGKQWSWFLNSGQSVSGDNALNPWTVLLS